MLPNLTELYSYHTVPPTLPRATGSLQPMILNNASMSIRHL
jgi:hypothetical protein